MTERDQPREAERLSDEAARRVLHRASELEAARGGEMSVGDLREAAREAGIMPGAFEQALAEYRGNSPSAPGVATRDGAWLASGRPRSLSPSCCRSCSPG